jgi:hypothetical protein
MEYSLTNSWIAPFEPGEDEEEGKGDEKGVLGKKAQVIIHPLLAVFV